MVIAKWVSYSKRYDLGPSSTLYFMEGEYGLFTEIKIWRKYYPNAKYKPLAKFLSSETIIFDVTTMG
jgi:hypothetical protein